MLYLEWFRHFARILFPWNFAYAKFRENKTLANISEFTVIDKWAKGTTWHEHPSKTQTSLRIHAVWSEPSMGTLWVAKGPNISSDREFRLLLDCGCTDQFELSLYDHANLYLMLDTSSNVLTVTVPINVSMSFLVASFTSFSLHTDPRTITDVP